MKRCYNFSPDQAAAIDRLAGELGIDKTEVLTGGLRLLRLAVRSVREGRRLGIVEGDRIVTEVDGAWSDLEPATA